MSRSTVNRVVLGLVAVVLLAGALLVLAGGLHLYRRLGVTPPSGWPLTSARQPVLSSAARTRWRDREWWWPAVVGALAVLVLLALWWLAAQLRRPVPAELDRDTADHPGLRLRVRSAALVAAVRETAVGLPRVSAARVALTGRPEPKLRAVLLLEPGTDPGAAVAAFRTGPNTAATATLGSPTPLPLDLRLQVAPTPKPREPRERRRRRAPRVQ
ncbi:alkaline shock response membrane anchor protein AmaP [Streptomyces tateyamensis]|uniref:Alkaline shock response membrane anchor protein AmaP n=1 Tax=Streptomyces tateyamensis TaxID=565073 RepID=A0A2V4MSM3_9ACTN|nr:alkaline shock response membrane anchor protein AmaP [Streptomyces tateyamensis]PYC65746.1 alkaline shock response membrane anchor protein AmaP [Streptomyces tateyamensis]